MTRPFHAILLTAALTVTMWSSATRAADVNSGAAVSQSRANMPGANPAAAAGHFSVADFGAVPDGKTMNTGAFAKAIDACAAVGGGRVTVPPGVYLTGPIHLKSNVEFRVEKGATILFSRNFADYPLIIGNYEGREAVQCTSPISGDNLQNVSITGGGTFDGSGDAWRPVKHGKLTDEQWAALTATGGVVQTGKPTRNKETGAMDSTETWYPTRAWIDRQADFKKLRDAKGPQNTADYAQFPELLRPPLLVISNSKHVLLDGPTFKNSPSWNLHPLLCDDLTIRNCTIFNYGYAQNGDGIDVDSCSNVLITHDDVNAGDDGICLKSGRDEEGRKRARPTEHVVVTDCTVGTGHGGIVIGSEMSGGVRDVRASNLAFKGTDIGIRLKSVRGRGGVVEDVHIDHITMSGIKGAAVTISTFYQVERTQPGGRIQNPPVSDAAPIPQADDAAPTPTTDPMHWPVNEGTPTFRDIHVGDVTCESAKIAFDVHGLPEMPIQNISLENVTIQANEPGAMYDVKGLSLRHVHVTNKKNVDVPVTRVTDVTRDDVSGIAEAPSAEAVN